MPALEKADKIPFGGLLQEIQPCAAKHRESCQARKGAAVSGAFWVPQEAGSPREDRRYIYYLKESLHLFVVFFRHYVFFEDHPCRSNIY